jgi:hypothetical protein
MIPPTREQYAVLFKVGADSIAAGFEVLVAAVWLKNDGTLAKAPLHVHGHLDAHRDEQLLREQLVNPPHLPKGVPDNFELVVAFVPGSGGCGVLDADVKGGKAGLANLRRLVAEHGKFAFAAWRSPSGGVNVLFRKPADAAFSNRSPWEGIDVRADNGWVVAPGNSCLGGDWAWIGPSDFTTARELPEPMVNQLRPANLSVVRATNAETVAFIEASPTTSSLPAMTAFGAQLDQFKAAVHGGRHGALVQILAWCWGMRALDLRWALEQIRPAWLALTPNEGRADEVDEFACWVTAQERTKRATEANGASPVIDASANEPEPTSLRTVTLSSVENTDARRVRWLWAERMPLGALTLLGGREGIGKSILAYTVAAEITKGTLEGELYGQPRPVVVAATEDAWAETIIPRLIVAGADRSLILRVDVKLIDGRSSVLTLPQDIEGLHQATTDCGAALVLLDPLMSRLDAALDAHRDKEVRQALEPMVDYADQGRYSVLGLIHVTKSTSNDPLTLLMASRAFAAVARAVLFTTLDAEQPGMRLLGQAKNNMGKLDLPTLMFEIVEAVAGQDPDDGLDILTGKLRWGGVSQRSILDALHDAARTTDAKDRQKEAEGWLRDYLRATPVAFSKDIKDAAAEEGIKERTLDRARKKIGAGVCQHGFPRRTYWGAPGMTPKQLEEAVSQLCQTPEGPQDKSPGQSSDDIQSPKSTKLA